MRGLSENELNLLTVIILLLIVLAALGGILPALGNIMPNMMGSLYRTLDIVKDKVPVLKMV